MNTRHGQNIRRSEAMRRFGRNRARTYRIGVAGALDPSHPSTWPITQTFDQIANNRSPVSNWGPKSQLGGQQVNAE